MAIAELLTEATRRLGALSSIEAIVLLVVISAYFASFLYRQDSSNAAPRLGKHPWLWDARAHFARYGRQLTELGYSKYKESTYWVQTGDMDRLVIPNRYVAELSRLPATHLDSKTAVVERNLGWYNRVDIILKSTAHVEVCRTQLVQNLDQVIQNQIDDLPDILKLEIGDCYKDTDVHFYNANKLLLNLVNRSMSRTLVGKPLCYDEKWLHTVQETTVNTGMVAMTLRKYPSLLRPIVFTFMEARRKLKRSFNATKELLAPTLETLQPGDKNAHILQWLVDSHKGNESGDDRLTFLANQILFVAIAATRSTATSIVNALYDIAVHPEYQEVLQTEIKDAIAQEGGWNLKAVQAMKKLDSFIKESQRLNHHILLSFNRKVRRPIELSDGMKLAPGTFISTAAYWAARDPEIFEGGEEFRPWRWLELRDEAEKQGKTGREYLASATSPANLHWGYGRNACPGRFMAAAEMKLVLAWLLWEFEVVLPKGQTTRPESLFMDERVIPNPTQEIGFRRRRHD